MYKIGKSFSFSASHQLGWLPKDHPCSRLHGHNYRVEVLLQAPTLDDNWFVLDFNRLDAFGEYLKNFYDHRHLNDSIAKPTAENIAKIFYDWCKGFLSGYVCAVRVWETEKCWGEYSE